MNSNSSDHRFVSVNSFMPNSVTELMENYSLALNTGELLY